MVGGWFKTAEVIEEGAGGVADGSFSVSNWGSYPNVGGGLRPEGPFRILEGSEYQEARNLANQTNRALRQANLAVFEGFQIHEIQPAKFGRSPTDIANKILLRPTEHAEYTNYWNAMLRNFLK